ncbi:MAG: type I restriction endonuclease subunit R [Candidatus Cryptobacteroides sp.]
MSITATNEQAFEALIERALTGSTLEERKTHPEQYPDIDHQIPGGAGYYWGMPDDFDKKFCIDRRRLWSFLESTQQEELDRLVGGDYHPKVENELLRYIDSHGTLEVLKNGLDVDHVHFQLLFPKPAASDSEVSKEKYATNQFSVTRQQTYSFMHPGYEIDMVIYVNGLPIITMELKNPWTGQTAWVDGKAQYIKDRDPKDPLLKFGRCLVHFTLDKNEIYMTTCLAKEKTFFMPFNKGLPDGMGAGNPAVEPGKHKVAYFWENILQKDSLSDIILNYALVDYGEAKTGKKVPHILKNAKKLIFPRYHQLDVVSKLLADVSEKGVGERYLIEHSAGSGKSNSITWLAYRLISVTPKARDAKRSRGFDSSLFDTVIVVTDRRLLDSQISKNISAFGGSEKIITHADSSKELKDAIEQGKRIVITTIQKFPYICGAISDMSSSNFAVIIDEAHSSQSGIAADKMNATTYKDESEEADKDNLDDVNALIEKMMKERKMSPNTSYFAFTATPKRETFERFCTQERPDGKFRPFHLYSMKQAIEEHFILDVLFNYTTFKSYYELTKTIEDNPLYDKERAQSLLKRYVERDPEVIAIKAEVLLKHFDGKIFRAKKLKGKAKAMVATQDIECAIRYYFAIKKQIEDNHLPYNVLIAFSGSKMVDGVEYTESQINGFSEGKLVDEFEKDENRILVVANKYLTGFDQPKLCAMYVDKRLGGVTAVQALSRLNRSADELNKESEDLFILDFFNKAEEIKDSFDPFYTATTLTGPTNVNVLNELRGTLLGYGVFDAEEIAQFIYLYFTGEEADKWSYLIDTAAQRFNIDLDWDNDAKIDFKVKAKQFVKIYSRIAAILPYENRNWEELFWFLRFLIPELKVDVPGRDDLKDLLDSVDLSTYGLRRTQLDQPIQLDDKEAEINPLAPKMVSGGEGEVDNDQLDRIVKTFNERWFDGWKSTPEDQKMKLVSLAKSIAESPSFRTKILGNPDAEETAWFYEKLFDKVMAEKRKSDMDLYKLYKTDKAFAAQLQSSVRKLIDNGGYLTEYERIVKRQEERTLGVLREPDAPAYGNQTQEIAKKCLAVSIKQNPFEAIMSGEKDFEEREVRPTTYRQLVYFVRDGVTYQRFEDIPDFEKEIMMEPIKYDQLKLITGQMVGKRPYAVVNVEGAHVEFVVDGDKQVFVPTADGRQFPLAIVVYDLGEITERSDY